MVQISNGYRPAPLEGESKEPYIFTTVRYDSLLLNEPANTAASCNRPCPFYMLEHHWTRLKVAKWSTIPHQTSKTNSFFACQTPAYLLYGLNSAVKQWQDRHDGVDPESLRIKLRSFEGGRMTTEISACPRIPLSYLFPSTFALPANARETEWTVVLDNQATEATETTMFKTSDRRSYGRARAAAGITSLMAPREVILYTPDDSLLDGSITTPYFYRAGCWVTPASSCGGQQGTTRRWALEKGLCIEGVVLRQSMTDGETVWLSNAVRGFYWAVFVGRDVEMPCPKPEVCDKIARTLR